MFVALPTPVLSVAADAVRDLDGGEALPGLWTLFTKCKESLRDGRRLENMCWRLWYREMMISSGDRYEYTFDSNSEKWFIEADDRAYRPPTPEEVAQQVLSNGFAPVQAPQMTDRLTCVTSTRPTATRRLSSVSLMKRAKPISTGVGKIICDLLPQSLPPQEELRRAVSSWRTASTASAKPTPETCPLRCDQPPSDLDAKRTSLPTPSTDNSELRVHLQSNENFPEGPTSPDPVDSSPMQLLEAQDPSGSEVPALTIVDTSSPPAPLIATSNLIHASPESSLRDPDPSLNATHIAPAGLTQPPPRLIIVNPTPNPTPHPTPPATPVLSSASSQFILATGVHITVPSGNQHLIPPPLFHMAPVLPVVAGGLESEQSLIVQGDTSTADVPHALITSVAETGVPRMQREDLQVPPSPALTEEALVPPQPETMTMNPIDREQLHHPLTIQTKIESVTSKRSSFLMLVPSSPSVIAHIFGQAPSAQDVTDSPTKSIFSSPTKDTASIDSPSKKSGKGSPRPREPIRRQSSGGGKPTSSTRKISRANSTGNVVIAPTISSGTQSRSGSRSRSRESHGPGLGLGGGALTMTRTTSAGGSTRSRSKVAVVSRAGARLGARKAADKERERSKSKDRIEEKDDDDDTLKRPTFNIGSNSDEGSGIGSKSVGSGSEVSGAVAPVAIAVMLSEVKEEEVKIVEEEADIKMVIAETQGIPDEDALLPQQQRRIVLATSESDEYETESDEWSSEDMSADDAEVVKSGGNNAQRPKAQMQPQQPQQPQPQPQPPPPPPTQQHRAGAHAHVDEANRHKHLPTHHHPPHHPHAHHPHAHHIEKLSQLVRNTKRQSVNHGKAHVQSIEQAALEAQRQREMFAKIPPSQNLARTTSVGLLSQLMNPDPQIFPPNHPYRRGLSTGEIRSGQGHIRLHPGLTMTGAAGPVQANLTQFQAQRPTQPHQPAQRNSQEQGQGTLAPPVAAPTEVRRHVSAPQQHQHAGPPGTGMLAPGLKPSKSSAAGPVASQVLVGSVRPNTGVSVNGVLNSPPGVSKQGHHPHARDNVRPSGGYRPRARPQDAELEEESESEDERAIQLSKSVAQEKLRALAERRGIRPNRRASTDDEPAWAQQQHQHHHQRHHSHLQPPPGPVRMHTSPAPIPQVLAHPYNLPLTALPTTPRTTRLHMMQTEMSESLRRNLLWERRVSKNNILGFRRTASSGGGAQGNVINGLRPLTTNEPPNVVHLSAKGTTNNNINGNAGGAVPAIAAGGAGQESSTRAFSRNRSWAANDYHYAGW